MPQKDTPRKSAPGVQIAACTEKLCGWPDPGALRVTGGEQTHGPEMSGTWRWSRVLKKARRLISHYRCFIASTVSCEMEHGEWRPEGHIRVAQTSVCVSCSRFD